MQAIQVKYFEPTYRLPQRFKAFLNKHDVYFYHAIPDQARNTSIRAAVIDLCNRLNLGGTWLGGTLPNQDWCFVCVDPDSALIVGM